MHHQHVKYLIAGGGVAASAAAQAIRQRDRVSPLLMVGQENSRPYQRSPLSKDFLLRRGRSPASDQREDLFALPPDYFPTHNIDLRTGRRVEHLDVARRAATLDNGEEISYDALLLATGATPRRLDVGGADLPNLFYLRTLADAERFGHAIDKARAEGQRHEQPLQAVDPMLAYTGRGKAVVIGGGVLGVELAATLAQLGLAVELLVGREYPWRRFAGDTAGQVVTRLLTNHGVTVHNDVRAQELQGDGRVQRVITDGGRSIACDFAIAAVGTAVNRELLRNTPIAAETAVLVNERCQSSERHIFAAGDCAAIFDPRFGKHRVVDHANHAVATGTIAGINMAGGEAHYGDVLGGAVETPADGWTTTLFGQRAHIFGEPRLVYRWIVRGSAAGSQPNFTEIGVAADGRVGQVLCFGECPQREALQQLVEQRVNVSGMEETLKDPATALPTEG